MRDKSGWSLIFGRLVVGWLEAHAVGDPPGLIVANPTFLDRRGPRIGHTEGIITAAAVEDAEQLDAVADCLIEEGNAAEVRGLVLARAPWRPR